jgi:hypothetical protein
MKLIDLLVKELPRRGGWPERALNATQDKDGEVCFSEGATPVFCSVAWHNGDWCANGFITITASDYDTAIITREQYESALEASESWIDWHGGECPVDSDAIVEVKRRWHNPHKYNNDRAGDFSWSHTGGRGDIIAYRLHNPEIKSRANDDRLEQDLNECIGASEEREWSGDGIPPIGCECEMRDSKGAWLPVVIIAKNDGFTFGWSYDYRIVLFGDKADEFRPLRTEAEKLREDGIAEMLRALYGPQEYTYREICELIYDAGYRKEIK